MVLLTGVNDPPVAMSTCSIVTSMWLPLADEERSFSLVLGEIVLSCGVGGSGGSILALSEC